MSTNYSESENPGQQLQTLLTEIYPIGEVSGKNFISKLDCDLRAEGEFIQIIYKSSINYLVRRLIRTAQYIREISGNFSDLIYHKELRGFLQNELGLPKGQIEKTFILLLECVSVSEKRPTQKTKDRIVRKARKDNYKCYICGCDLDFTQPNIDSSVEVDHLWPNSLGGESNDSNLIACCRRCNQAKHDHIDTTDFHFEEIAFYTDTFPSENTLRDREHRVALWAKNDYKCCYGKCKSTPRSSGELLFERKNPDDSWHYLNIETYCSEHI
jgi:5-methylcytosine-specific restriction endonuclease McrA